MKNSRCLRAKTALLLVDLQESLISHMDRSSEVLCTVQKVIKGAQFLQIPILVSEQYPQGLGSTIPGIKNLLGESQAYIQKTTFSCWQEESFKEKIEAMAQSQWILVGIEAHICVLQTARDLLQNGKEVVVLNDAITSRSVYDFSTAIAEMRDMGVRVSSTETILFELLQDSKDVAFKKISQLVR